MENNELNLDQLLGDEWDVPQEEPANEIKKIRGSLRKRSISTIAISVALAALLLAVTVFGVIPFVESLYWNPEDTTYMNKTDLETTLHAYTELFLPGYHFRAVTHQKTGFASWSLDIRLSSPQGGGVYRGTLNQNTLTVSQQLTEYSRKSYYFTRWRDLTYAPDPEYIAEMSTLLQELPSYIKLEAAITFSDDLSREALLEFHDRWCPDPERAITWAAVRGFEPNGEWTHYCGFDPAFHGGAGYNGLFIDYPHFNLGTGEHPRQLEQHFKSLLQYTIDRVEEGKGIVHYDDPDIYQNILDYVNENGVYTYGCIVTASPEALLELMQDSDVCYIYLSDGWIDVN